MTKFRVVLVAVFSLIALLLIPVVGAFAATPTFLYTSPAPADATKVTFILDGVYLGDEKVGPWTWNVPETSGSHVLKTRWDAPEGAGRAEYDFTVSPSPTATPTVSPSPTPTGTVTGFDLQAALNAATPGVIIVIPMGTYTGTFIAGPSGTAAQPITLDGSVATLTAGSISGGYGLHVIGSYWDIKGLTVTNSGKGIVLDGSVGTVLDSVNVGNIGDEAIHFRKGSASSSIVNSFIHDTGLKSPGYGEGIYIGSANSNWTSIMGSNIPDPSNDVTVSGNTITNTAAEGTDIKEGTTGGFIVGNTYTNAGYSGQNFADSWVDVKGNGYTLSGNTGTTALLDAFQVHSVLTGWGDNNIFANNTVTGVPGYEVRVQSNATGTVIHCQPSGAALGLANIACQ